ncbi:MAG: DUF721 domain-containing protein [Nitrospirae bacterium]|nr:DUF721 domain-containing protein [Candidatus Manganitrophaceae bacterium]
MPCTMKEPAAISPILKTMNRKLGLEKEMIFYRLKKEWPTFVGQTLSEHTRPERLKFKMLTLSVDGPTWMHELTFLKKDIIKKINTRLGKNLIQTLHLKIGILPSQDLPKKHTRFPQKALSPEAKTLLQEQLSPLKDSPLKKAIREAMERHLRKNEGQ